MSETTISMTREAFSAFYRRLSGDTSLMTAMTGMQSGVTDRKAYEIADAIIRDVAAFEGTLECVSGDTAAVIDSFLAEAPVLQGENRMLQLHRLHFGLKVYADAGLVEAVKEGTGKGDLFQKYYDACCADPTITEETLTDAIRQQLGSLAFSPEVMRAIAKKLETSNSLLTDSIAVGADGQRFKCLLAMQLYESGKAQGMTTAEAVALACASAETQAIADAAGRGMITQSRVNDLLMYLALAILLFALLCPTGIFTPLLGTAAIASETGHTLLLTGLLVSAVSDAVSRLAGRVSAQYHFSHADRHAAMMAGFHRMGDALKERANGLKNKAASLMGAKKPAAAQAEELYDEDPDPSCAF